MVPEMTRTTEGHIFYLSSFGNEPYSVFQSNLLNHITGVPFTPSLIYGRFEKYGAVTDLGQKVDKGQGLRRMSGGDIVDVVPCQNPLEDVPL